ncbi:hypothetical protein BGZ83_000871 [Gryganskiella cystojenkinii]|nr:hypothetical protein BGZ83_000871 [Gryganskiella cystojenkinii]
MTTFYSGVTSVVFVGNPGAGKSTLHNALGGSFRAGFSPVVGMSVDEPQRVICDQRHLLLVDVPGIRDHSTAGDIERGESAIDRNLRVIQTLLNNGDHYVVFFVIALTRNGTIGDGDIQVMKVFLENLERGPQIGLILTQIHKSCLGRIGNNLVFVTTAVNRVGGNLGYLAKENVLILPQHEDHFSDEDRKKIQSYILGFKPSQVRLRKMHVLQEESHSRAEDTLALLMPERQRQQQQQHKEQSLQLLSLRDTTLFKRYHRTVILFGGPGTGKSTILSALGGNFRSGVCNVSGIRQVTKDVVTLHGKNIELLDFPGVVEGDEQSFQAGLDELTDAHRKYLIFFVITPRNGRIDPSELPMYMFLRDRMPKSLNMGLIFTQIRNRHFDQMEEGLSSFARQVDLLSDRPAKKTGYLALRDHDEEFDDQETKKIQEYILSFPPTKIKFEDSLRKYFKFFQKGPD